MRMYVLIRDDVPPGPAITAAAHASLACYLEFAEDAQMRAWLDDSFKKVVCRVGATEFEQAKAFPDRVIMTESALDGRETAIAFKPREDWPKPFHFYALWR